MLGDGNSTPPLMMSSGKKLEESGMMPLKVVIMGTERMPFLRCIPAGQDHVAHVGLPLPAGGKHTHGLKDGIHRGASEEDIDEESQDRMIKRAADPLWIAVSI